MEATPFVNRVEQSGLITIDLLDFYPKEEFLEFDIKPFLFQELILKEKEFRAQLEKHNWEDYSNKHIAIFCSVESIIPHWAFMLISKYLYLTQAKSVFYGSAQEYISSLFSKNIENIDFAQYQGKKIILKGCNDERLTSQMFTLFSFKALPFVQSLMYGEACSNVPIYKKPK